MTVHQAAAGNRSISERYHTGYSAQSDRHTIFSHIFAGMQVHQSKILLKHIFPLQEATAEQQRERASIFFGVMQLKPVQIKVNRCLFHGIL